MREGRLLPVPVSLRDSHYAGAKRLGHGEGYEYAHDAPDGVAAQDYLGVDKTTIAPYRAASSKSWPSGSKASGPRCGPPSKPVKQRWRNRLAKRSAAFRSTFHQ